MTADVYLNGRKATDFEAAAVERGRRCEHERDLAMLAGLLAAEEYRPDVQEGRPVMNVFPDLI